MFNIISKKLSSYIYPHFPRKKKDYYSKKKYQWSIWGLKLPKQPRLNANEAEKLLFQSGFALIRTQGSHRIYQKDSTRVVIPFHGKKILHPKIVKQVVDAIQDN